MTAQKTFISTIIVILTLAAAYVLFVSARILIVLLIAIIIASAIRPAVLRLKKSHIPEGIAILLIYLLIGLSFFILGAIVLPPAIAQFSAYVNNEQGLASRLIVAQDWLESNLEQLTGSDITLIDPNSIRATVSDVMDRFTEAMPSAASEAGGLAGDFILMVVMGVYWLTSRNQAVEFLQGLFPLGQRAHIAGIIEEIEISMGAYLSGVVLVALFVGIANFAILALLRVPNAVTLAFIVGITTALPIIGGYIGGISATLLALLSSPINGLITILTFVGVQQIETHYLTPRVMSRSVGLNPILIIVVLFIGFAVGGVVGGLIAVPFSGILSILVKNLIIVPRQDYNAPQHVEGGILLTVSDEDEANLGPRPG
jgi:predicted PurR-regulated permease PerM